MIINWVFTFLQDLRKELIGKPGEFHYQIVDLCSEQNIKEAFAWVKRTLKSVDVLVNNAGVWKNSDVLGKQPVRSSKINYLNNNNKIEYT